MGLKILSQKSSKYCVFLGEKMVQIADGEIYKKSTGYYHNCGNEIITIIGKTTLSNAFTFKLTYDYRKRLVK